MLVLNVTIGEKVKAQVSTNPFVKFLLKRVATIGVTWAAIVGCFIITLMMLGVFLAPTSDYEGSYSYVYGDGTNQLLSIQVSGTITGTTSAPGFLGALADWETSGYAVKEQLYAAANDDLINGVILEIESPGGTIYGSRAIADGVAHYKEATGNPVYAYVEGLAASGGYWAAVSADKIIADYGSEVGSIGVIMGPFQYYDQPIAEDGGAFSGGIITQNGIENTMITAGKSKDIGNPYRRLTNEEIQLLQQSINDEYDNFVQYVSKQRKISESDLRNNIGAMIYGNKAAQQLKLIDKTGSRETAYAELAKAADIEDDFQIIREEYIPGFLESLLMATVRKPQPQATTSGCTLIRGSLVYHGDVASLCKP